MNKTKIFSLLATSILLTTPSVLAISCQLQEREEVALFVPFKEQGETKSYNTVKEIINRFNATLVNDKEYKKNKLVLRNDLNKKDVNNKINLELQTKDYRAPSIVLGYPSVVPRIKENNRLVDLSEISKVSGISNYSKNILDYNNRLGFKNDGHIYNLPIGIASESLIINDVLLSFYLDALYKVNKEKNINNQNIENIKKSKDLNAFLEKSNQFKDLTKQKEVKIEFDEKTLRSWDLDLSWDIFAHSNYFNKFSNLIRKSLKNFSIKQGRYTSNIDILYVRHIENYIYGELFKKAESDFKNYAINYTADNKFNFDIFKKGTKEYKDFYSTIKDFYSNLKNNVIKVEKLKNYVPASFETQLFTIATTRLLYDKGAITFFNANKGKFSIKNVPFKANDKQKNGSYFIQGLFLSAIKSDIANKNKVVEKFLNWFYDEKNLIEWNFSNHKVKLSPVEYLALNLVYLYPSNNFEKTYKELKEIQNDSNNLVIENIKNQNLVPLTDLVDYQGKNELIRIFIKKYVNDFLLKKAKNKDTNDEKVVKDLIEKIHENIK
ncbi:Hypothetical protein, predicted lipoprotein [Metamycoplasma auris 15026]|uniref:Mycoplasma lipoprotein C-terminal domain-containing protein n=1 Tax=Metamycoplasma auris 15026 TaxID=1188233 RepID=N9TRD9_9BACT|nr:hypothetical protein [Metamycoplasma auris]ENY68719.1 Hypothetical protein, predicted lipoprotein [Metamycoplasma auris 15026]